MLVLDCLLYMMGAVAADALPSPRAALWKAAAKLVRFTHQAGSPSSNSSRGRWVVGSVAVKHAPQLSIAHVSPAFLLGF